MAKHRTGHLFKRGEAFYLSWRVNGKKFTHLLRDDKGSAITNKREAEAAQVKLMSSFMVADETAAYESIAAKLAGRKGELDRLDAEKNPPLPLDQVWATFLATPNRPDSGDSTLEQYKGQFAAFAEWMGEKHPEVSRLRGVTGKLAEEYASHLMARGVSANTYNKHLNLLGLVFRVLKSKAKLADNPWTEIERKRLTTQSRRELTVEELRNVCLKAKGELRTLLGLGVFTGLRLGDCATLRRGEVDLARGFVRRVPNKTARRNPKPVIVPLSTDLKVLLAEALKAHSEDYVLPKTAASYLTQPSHVTDEIQGHLLQCGVMTHKEVTGVKRLRAVVEVGFHSLRHTFVSICREKGIPLAVVESIVGHNNPAMTRHYTHIGELAAQEAVAKLPAVFGAEAPKERDPLEIIGEARRLAEAMTKQNWCERRDELVRLLAKVKGAGESHALVEAKKIPGKLIELPTPMFK